MKSIFLFETTWMDFENTILNEVSQILYDFTYI